MASKRRKQRKARKSTSYKAPSGYNRHHRLPKSRGGQDTPSNISVVLRRHHDAYNMLFGSNPTAHEVARVLTEVWIDSRYEIIVRLKEVKNEDDHEDEAPA